MCITLSDDRKETGPAVALGMGIGLDIGRSVCGGTLEAVTVDFPIVLGV